MKNGMLRVEEVSVLIGKSTFTINAWYRFARKHPDSDIAKMLPKFIQKNERSPRYWKHTDVYKLIEIQSKIPLGRSGPMGKYNGKGTNKDGKRSKADSR